MKIKPVIMAGGFGTRLWPLSLNSYPKQFIKIFEGLSLLQKTLIRNKSFAKPILLINHEHKSIVIGQIRDLGIEVDLIIEPTQKNTAPCAIIAALVSKAEGFDRVLLLPSDHEISDIENYLQVVARASYYAESMIVTIGIKPEFIHTGYGYIKSGQSIGDRIYKVEQFIEKPNETAAAHYVSQQNYFWNSGIFLYSPDVMIEQARSQHPILFNNVQNSLIFGVRDKDKYIITLDQRLYSSIENISLDYAIMEHAKEIALIEANFNWDDLGSWASLWRISSKDPQNNVTLGNVVVRDVTNSYVRSCKKVITVVGLDNIIVVETEDALLVANKSKSEEIKDIVNEFSTINKKESEINVKDFRPWGYYKIIDNGDLHKVKRIVVYPGHKLSMQYHNNRSEHWIIVKGTAEIIIGKEVAIMHENNSIYIPNGITHRLSNIGVINLQIIEVQIGYYLDERDIVRLADDYDRV